MTMKFVLPARTPATRSSYSEMRPESKNLHLESSNVFRFENARDGFRGMPYTDANETTKAAAPDPPPPEPSRLDGVLLSNQTTHERHESIPSPATTSTVPHFPGPSRRKNSIEMFLSQSPSQALGGDFLKLSLEDRHLSLESTNRRHASAKVVVNDRTRTTRPDSSNVYASGTFQLNTIAKSTSSTRSTHTRRSHPANLSETTAIRSSPSNMMPTTYRQEMYPPPLAREETWSKNCHALHDYYPTIVDQPLPSYQPYQSSTLYNYTTVQPPIATGPWNPMVINHPYPPNGAMYDGGNYLYVTPRSNPMGYVSHQPVPMGLRSSTTRLHHHGRHVYTRMPPPLPGMSPLHSPRKGFTIGTKQCKFYLQGHCRMGHKCKFGHSGSPSTNERNYSMVTRERSPGMYQQPLVSSTPGMPLLSTEENPHGPATGRQQPRYNLVNTTLSLPSTPDVLSLNTALSVADIETRVFVMSKDQNGCRLLQEQLEYTDRKDLCDVIYHESLDHLPEMMVDPFGNYLFQKLLERVRPRQRLVMIRRVSSNLVAAALNLHGTRSVQKVVEVCATSMDVLEDTRVGNHDDCDEFPYLQETETNSVERGELTRLSDLIVHALKDDAVRLCIDSNGNHVIQRALQFMKAEYNQFVFDAVCLECTTVGTHRHGCCVLQRCLDAANTTQKTDVIAQVERQAMKLMQDPYGNYVVQYVLDSCTSEEAYGVIRTPLGHIYDLSIQKFSSNVIEKCLEKAPECVRHDYVAEMIACPKMNKMLQDQFANYVVQRALCVCAEEQCRLLVKAIRPHLAAMKNTSGGRRITARILKRFPTMDLSLDGGFVSSSSDLLFDGMDETPRRMHSLVALTRNEDYLHPPPMMASSFMYGMQGFQFQEGHDEMNLMRREDDTTS